jgi:hypothetical protein
MIKSLMHCLLFATLLALVAGCGSSGASKAEIELSIKESIEENTGFAVEKVTLLKESENVYSGLVYFKDGDQKSLRVVVDGDTWVYEEK